MKRIGKGAYGKVYEKNDNEVVKKTDILNKDNEIELCQQNLQEIVFLKTFKHVNIASAKKISIENKEYHIEMKKYDTSLQDFIMNNKYLKRLEQFDNIFYQLVCGLYFIHKNGLIHGDLKPDNIMYNNDKKIIKIIDFGCINTFRLLEEHNTLCTLYYRPPEAFKNLKNSKYDSKFDIWSLGVTMYYYLTKYYVIETEDNSDEGYQKKFEKLVVSGEKIILDTKIRDDIKLILGDMLYYDPKKRISIDDLINHNYFNNHNKIISPLNDLSSIKFPSSGHLLLKFDTSFIHSLDEIHIAKRKKIVQFVYDCLNKEKSLNCFVLSISLMDVYLCKNKSVIYFYKYKLLAVSIMIIVSNILLDKPFSLNSFNKIIKPKNENVILDKIKEILNILEFKLYYNTFDWILYKCINPSMDIDYNKIKDILSVVDNIGKDNDYLISLYLIE